LNKLTEKNVMRSQDV